MQTAPANILIVDDTPENLTVLRDILTRSGYRVRPVLQGALALKSAFAETPDLILLDIMMPGMDGFETCRQLRADPRTREVPVLFISALDATDSKVRAFTEGGLDYIIKPFQAEEVLARVRTHLALHAARQQLRTQNEELTRAARLREDVDRMLRHDLRGPLHNLIGYSELIVEEAPPDSQVSQHARTMAGAGYAMLSMIHASFDLMKMERGEYVLKAEPFDAVEVLRHVLAELALAAETKGVRFDLTFAEQDAADIIVRGERLLCRSLFYNLVKNALEASPAGQTVSFRLGHQGEHAEIRLRNAGEVPPSIRTRFFEKYVTAGKADGTGLGTFSARLMAETQHGTLDLDTTEPSHTTLIVRLPRASAGDTDFVRRHKAQAASNPRPKPVALPAADLLIADDDAANRAYLQHILPTPPLQLHFATHGAEALAILRRQPINAALIDIEMPGMDGVELVRTYRTWHRNEKNVPGPAAVLIAFTGHTDAATRERCLQAGFDRILAKPITKQKLYEELRDALTLGPSVVLVDRAIADLIPEFLVSQRRQAEELEGLAAAADHQRLASVAHRLQGSFAMYGFDAASRLTHEISLAAQASDLDAARRHIAALRAHLTSLEIRYI